MKFAEPIVDATREIFETMLMVDLDPEAPGPVPHGPFAHALSAIIGLTGGCHGQLSIHLPHAVAIGLTRDFLGHDVDSVDDDVCDAMGELANMIAGGIKPHLDPTAGPIDLSVPSVIHGPAYSLGPLRHADGISVPFRVSHGRFRVDLELVPVTG